MKQMPVCRTSPEKILLTDRSVHKIFPESYSSAAILR